MSAKKKPKKLRRPNIVMDGFNSGLAEGRGGGAETLTVPRSEAGRSAYDYTHVKNDLRRIGLLAGLCVSILVVLSFIIR